MRAALADVPVTRDDDHFARDHDVRRALDTVRKRFAAPVKVVELAFRYAVVHIDRGDLQFPARVHLIEPVNARGRFFGKALHAPDNVRMFRLMHAERQVAPVVDDHIERLTVREIERLLNTPVVFFVRLAFPSVDGNPCRGDRGSGVVLRRELVAARPRYLRAKFPKRFNQDGRLDRHMQTARNTRAKKGLRRPVFGAKSHQPGHLVFSEHNFLASPVGKAHIGDLIR